jgi:cytochrome c oxidase assembly factor CtaG
LVVLVVPPVSTLARRYEYLEALQYVCFVVLIPVLFVFGAPWKTLRIARHSLEEIRSSSPGELGALGAVDRWAIDRRRHRGPVRSVAALGTYAAAACIWRTPVFVNGLANHPWLLAPEAISLLVAGVWIWTELIESSPLAPRLVRPHRIMVGAVAMWIVWILAYVVALSHNAWYTAYHHHFGTGVSLSADQQLVAGVMWAISGVVYISLCFWNLFKWLQSEEDPNDELHHLIQIEKIRRGAGSPSGLPMN